MHSRRAQLFMPMPTGILSLNLTQTENARGAVWLLPLLILATSSTRMTEISIALIGGKSAPRDSLGLVLG